MTTAAGAAQVQTQQRPWWLALISGILAVVIGGVLAAKVQTYMLLVTFLGLWWMVQGIFDIAGIFVDRSTYLISAFLIRKDWLFTSFRSKR